MLKNTAQYNYCIFLHNGIGDLIMALPFLLAIKNELSPTDKVVVYVKCKISQTLISYADLGENFEFKVLNREKILSTCLILRKQKLDYLFAPQATGDWRMPALILLIGAKNSYGVSSNIPWLNRLALTKSIKHSLELNIHRTIHHLKLLKECGFKCKVDISPKLSIPRLLIDEAQQNILSGIESYSNLYIYSPGSKLNEYKKRWPAEYFAELANQTIANDNDALIVLSGDPSELELCQGIFEQIKKKNQSRVLITCLPDIRIFLGLLSLATVVVANCSAVSHIAAASGIKVLGLYGPTNPDNTGPISSNLYILRLGLECSPCYSLSPLYLGCEERPCLKNMMPSQVYKTLIDFKEGLIQNPNKWL